MRRPLLAFAAGGRKPWRVVLARIVMCASCAMSQGSVNGGFQTVVRVLSGHRIPLPPFNLSLTSFLPLFNLFLTSFLPQFNLCFVGNLQPRFVNHGLHTLGCPCFCKPWFPKSGWTDLNAGAWTGEPEIRRKAAGKRHFLATQLCRCCSAIFSLLQRSFW